jgi:endonuclease G
MSKVTFAIIAATSAVTGAAATAAFYNSKRQQTPAITTTTTTTTITSPTPTGPPALQAAFPQLQKIQAPVDPNGVFQYGFPGPIADLRPTASLTSSYDRQRRNPYWVAEHITPTSLSMSNGDRKHSVFSEDLQIPEKVRARLKDYYKSGYDRGHQVPAADCKWSQEAMDDTFALSNMCPQVGDGFNRDYWAHFEDFCRRLTTRYPSVRIVTGPLYLPKRDPADGKWRVSYEVIGNPPNIAVPTHFYKVIFAEDGLVGGQVAVGAFVLPNARIPNEKPLEEFEVPIEAVERASGLEFAGKLPSTRRKKLCAEMPCSLIIKEYKDRQKSFGKKEGTQVPKPAR